MEKEEVGKGCFEGKSAWGNQEFGLMMVSHWLMLG